MTLIPQTSASAHLRILSQAKTLSDAQKTLHIHENRAFQRTSQIEMKTPSISSPLSENHFSSFFRFLWLSGAIFALFFISMNAGSFWAIASGSFFSAEQSQKREEIDRSIGGKVENREQKLENIAPRIPKLVLPIAPPDFRLVIPKLGKNVPIVEVESQKIDGSDWEVFEDRVQDSLREGVVHYPGTANPGEGGNLFLTGHSSYYPWDDGRYKEVFALLGNLVVGDEFFVFKNGVRHAYRVSEIRQVLPKETEVLAQPKGKKIATLMTCWPVGTTLRRLVVVASEIENTAL